MNTLILSVLTLIIFELLEAWWQRSDTMLGVLANGYHYYQKSIFLFLLMHPSFYFVLFVILSTQILNGWMVTILLLKSVDIFFKITMMQNIFVKNQIDELLGSFLEEPLSPWIFLTGVSLYPFLLFYVLT
ncbi:MAG: hypothetical protein DRG30_09165 [Epsilonproteobacteria bacterium]|nr:MAG: hypothetical protein DRG30_09165 [Campylobacterota bacterium]